MYSFQAQFLINTSSNIESLIAIYYFSFMMKKRKYPYLLYPLTFVLSFGFIALFAWIRSMSSNIGTGILVTLLMNAYQLAFLFLLTKESLAKTIVEYIGAFSLNFILAQILGIPDIYLETTGFLPFGLTTGNMYWDLVIRLVFRAVLCFPLSLLLSTRKEVVDDNNVRKNVIIIISIASVFIAILTRFADLIPADDKVGRLLLTIGLIGFCVLVLYLRTRIFDYSKQQAEILVMQTAIESQNHQYEHFKDSVSYINTVCHDLKKSINLLSDILSQSELDSIQNAISLFNGRYKTGNESVDMVLSQSQLQCQKKNIQLTVLADGKALSFMSHYDCYALLNNALSNAIEAVDKVKDPKMKIISLVIASKPPFATIEVENYYDGNLLTDAKGEIESSKEDSRLHGLGIKSMKRILETYDGYMKIKTEDNIFDLFMAMPLKEENEVHADKS